MMEFPEWKVKIYRPPAFDAEDECQDPVECARLLKKDQETKYAQYVALNTPKDAEPTQEEKRVVDVLRNSVTLQSNGLRNTKSRAAYMREYRKRRKPCIHCGKDPRK